jgi:hypothetical protein
VFGSVASCHASLWIMAVRAIVVGIALGGCGRTGFDPPASTESLLDSRIDSLGAAPGDSFVTGDSFADSSTPLDASTPVDARTPDAPMRVAGDTCAQPIEVDLAPGSATVTFTTQGAIDDYPIASCCVGVPEIVFRIHNPTASVRIGCTGGGTYSIFYRGGGVCPDTTSGSCSTSNCSTGSSGTYNASEGAYFAVCRDPAAPTATLTFTNL